MRLWSIHPEYLDAKGLVALWREGLLAQKVLDGKTKGYINHPQLVRFRAINNPIGGIATYLRSVVDEADRRGYNFDRDKILNRRIQGNLPVSDKQIEYEFQHLLRKLKQRDHERFRLLKVTSVIRLHPLFESYCGAIEDWEVITGT